MQMANLELATFPKTLNRKGYGTFDGSEVNSLRNLAKQCYLPSIQPASGVSNFGFSGSVRQATVRLVEIVITLSDSVFIKGFSTAQSLASEIHNIFKNNFNFYLIEAFQLILCR